MNLCGCHGEAMLWNKDTRYKAGGFWLCGVTHRERARSRYDADPIYRITKRLKDDAAQRRRRIQRAKEGLRGEV